MDADFLFLGADEDLPGLSPEPPPAEPVATSDVEVAAAQASEFAFDDAPASPWSAATSEPDAAPPTQVSRPRRPRVRQARASSRRDAESSRLAGAVGVVREMEDDIRAQVGACQKLIRRLVARGVHVSAGYGSTASFEQRVLSSTPMLKALRPSMPPPLPKDVATPRARTVQRGRRLQALSAIAGAVEELRAMNDDVVRSALRAGETLATVEHDRLYEECLYASYEEFLERAIGPSPLLAQALALADGHPFADPILEGNEDPEPTASDAKGEPSSLTDVFAEPPSSAEIPVGPRASRPPKAASLPVPRGASMPFSMRQLAACAALCLLGTFVGSAGGAFSVVCRAQTSAHAKTEGGRDGEHDPAPSNSDKPRSAAPGERRTPTPESDARPHKPERRDEDEALPAQAPDPHAVEGAHEPRARADLPPPRPRLEPLDTFAGPPPLRMRPGPREARR